MRPLALAILVASVASVHTQEPNVFRGGTDVVSVDVSAARNGRPVRDLRQDEFEVFDNGVKQTIRDVTFEKLPVDATIALDVSASVTGRLLDELRRAVQQLRGDLRPGDRLKLMAFNMRVSRAVDFTEPGAPIDAAFSRISASGSTALYDTLAVALTTPTPPERRHLIVAFSDGNDTSSITEPSGLLDVAQATTATLEFVVPPLGGVTTVTLPDMSPTVSTPVAGSGAVSDSIRAPFVQRPATSPGIPVQALANRSVLTLLAKETGGEVVTMQPSGSIAQTFRRMLDDFRSSYVLHFSPQGVAPSGVHTLDVRIARSGVTVRARKSYAR